MGGPGGTGRLPPSQQPGGGTRLREFLARRLGHADEGREPKQYPPGSIAARWQDIHTEQPSHTGNVGVGVRGARGAVGRERYNFEVRRWAVYNEVGFQTAQRDTYFQYYYRILADMERRVSKGQDVDRSPGGLYARALEALNYRRPQSPWLVGETPKVRTA